MVAQSEVEITGTDFHWPCLLAEKKVHIEIKKKKTNDEIEAIWKKELIILGC